MSMISLAFWAVAALAAYGCRNRFWLALLFSFLHVAMQGIGGMLMILGVGLGGGPDLSGDYLAYMFCAIVAHAVYLFVVFRRTYAVTKRDRTD